MLTCIRLYRDKKVDVNSMMRDPVVPREMPQRQLLVANGSIRHGVEIMEQHVRDRDFDLTRNVIN